MLGFNFQITVQRVRNLLSPSATSQATTVEAEAFLTLYQEQLKDMLDERLRDFVKSKLAAK